MTRNGFQRVSICTDFGPPRVLPHQRYERPHVEHTKNVDAYCPGAKAELSYVCTYVSGGYLSVPQSAALRLVDLSGCDERSFVLHILCCQSVPGLDLSPVRRVRVDYGPLLDLFFFAIARQRTDLPRMLWCFM